MWSYDTAGNILTVTDTSGISLATLNPLRYRGYVYDHETGLYYLQSRYYDPELGRFLNADAFVSTGQGQLGNNMFAYCLNNPVIRKDVTGTAGVYVENFNDYNNPLNALGNPSGGGSHGGGAVALGVVSVGCALAVLSSTEALPNVVSWFEELLKQGERALSEAKAFAKTIAGGEKYVVHHIVAKAAIAADPARKVLESVDINPRTHGLNLAIIPEKTHRGLHTVSYYEYVNFQFAGLHNNKVAVILTLVRLQIEIQVYCETGIKAW